MPAPARDAAGRTVMLGGPGPLAGRPLLLTDVRRVSRGRARARSRRRVGHYASVVLHDPDAERAERPRHAVRRGLGPARDRRRQGHREQPRADRRAHRYRGDRGPRWPRDRDRVRAWPAACSRHGPVAGVSWDGRARGGGLGRRWLSPLRSRRAAPRRITSAGTPTPRARARIRTPRSHAPIATGYPLHPTYGYPVDDHGRALRDPETQVRSGRCARSRRRTSTRS